MAYKRKAGAGEKVPIVFGFTLAPQDLDLGEMIGVRWSDQARALLRDWNAAAEESSGDSLNLPYASLRAALEVEAPWAGWIDQSACLLDVGNEGKYGKPGAFLLADPDEASADDVTAAASRAIRSWLSDPKTAHFCETRGGERERKDLADALEVGALLEATLRPIGFSKSGTDIPVIMQHIARLCAGRELFTGCAPVRRIASSRSRWMGNAVELITPPIVRDLSSARIFRQASFSMVAELSLETQPADDRLILRVRPHVRRWLSRAPGGRGPHELRGTLFSDHHTDIAFPFQVRRSPKADWEPDVAYHMLQGSLEDWSAPDMASIVSGHATPSSFWPLINYNTQFGGHPLPAAVLEEDEADLFRNVAETLEGYLPLSPISGASVKSSITIRKHSTYRLSFYDHLAASAARRGSNVPEDADTIRRRLDDLLPNSFTIRDDALARTQKDGLLRAEVLRSDIAQALERIHGDESATLFLIAGTAKERRLMRELATTLVGDAVALQDIELPKDTHGLKSTLPGADKRARDRVAARVEAWRYVCEHIAEVEGVKYALIQAPDEVLVPAMDGNGSRAIAEDSVNYQSDIHALSQLASANVHHVLPPSEESEDALTDYAMRLQSALSDLLLAHNGFQWDVDALAERCFPEAPPDRLFGFARCSKAGGRFTGKQRQEVAYAYRLDIETGATFLRFASKSSGVTEWIPFREGLRHVASREALAAMHDEMQGLIDRCLSESGSDGKRSIALVDADSVGRFWPWMSNGGYAPSTIDCAKRPGRESDWGDIAILRVRRRSIPTLRVKNRSVHIDEDNPATPELSETYHTAMKQILRVQEAPDRYLVTAGYPSTNQTTRGLSMYRRTRRIDKNGERENDVAGSKTVSPPLTSEISVLYNAPGFDGDSLVRFCLGLRYGYGQTVEATALPAPLFFMNKALDYIMEFDATPENGAADAEEPEAPGRTPDDIQAAREADSILEEFSGLGAPRGRAPFLEQDPISAEQILGSFFDQGRAMTTSDTAIPSVHSSRDDHSDDQGGRFFFDVKDKEALKKAYQNFTFKRVPAPVWMDEAFFLRGLSGVKRAGLEKIMGTLRGAGCFIKRMEGATDKEKLATFFALNCDCAAMGDAILWRIAEKTGPNSIMHDWFDAGFIDPSSLVDDLYDAIDVEEPDPERIKAIGDQIAEYIAIRLWFGFKLPQKQYGLFKDRALLSALRHSKKFLDIILYYDLLAFDTMGLERDEQGSKNYLEFLESVSHLLDEHRSHIVQDFLPPHRTIEEARDAGQIQPFAPLEEGEDRPPGDEASFEPRTDESSADASETAQSTEPSTEARTACSAPEVSGALGTFEAAVQAVIEAAERGRSDPKFPLSDELSDLVAAAEEARLAVLAEGAEAERLKDRAAALAARLAEALSAIRERLEKYNELLSGESVAQSVTAAAEEMDGLPDPGPDDDLEAMEGGAAVLERAIDRTAEADHRIFEADSLPSKTFAERRAQRRETEEAEALLMEAFDAVVAALRKIIDIPRGESAPLSERQAMSEHQRAAPLKASDPQADTSAPDPATTEGVGAETAVDDASEGADVEGGERATPGLGDLSDDKGSDLPDGEIKEQFAAEPVEGHEEEGELFGGVAEPDLKADVEPDNARVSFEAPARALDSFDRAADLLASGQMRAGALCLRAAANLYPHARGDASPLLINYAWDGLRAATSIRARRFVNQERRIALNQQAPAVEWEEGPEARAALMLLTAGSLFPAMADPQSFEAEVVRDYILDHFGDATALHELTSTVAKASNRALALTPSVLAQTNRRDSWLRETEAFKAIARDWESHPDLYRGWTTKFPAAHITWELICQDDNPVGEAMSLIASGSTSRAKLRAAIDALSEANVDEIIDRATSELIESGRIPKKINEIQYHARERLKGNIALSRGFAEDYLRHIDVNPEGGGKGGEKELAQHLIAETASSITFLEAREVDSPLERAAQNILLQVLRCVRILSDGGDPSKSVSLGAPIHHVPGLRPQDDFGGVGGDPERVLESLVDDEWSKPEGDEALEATFERHLDARQFAQALKVLKDMAASGRTKSLEAEYDEAQRVARSALSEKIERTRDLVGLAVMADSISDQQRVSYDEQISSLAPSELPAPPENADSGLLDLIDGFELCESISNECQAGLESWARAAEDRVRTQAAEGLLTEADSERLISVIQKRNVDLALEYEETLREGRTIDDLSIENAHSSAFSGWFVQAAHRSLERDESLARRALDYLSGVSASLFGEDDQKLPALTDPEKAEAGTFLERWIALTSSERLVDAAVREFFDGAVGGGLSFGIDEIVKSISDRGGVDPLRRFLRINRAFENSGRFVLPRYGRGCPKVMPVRLVKRTQPMEDVFKALNNAEMSRFGILLCRQAMGPDDRRELADFARREGVQVLVLDEALAVYLALQPRNRHHAFLQAAAPYTHQVPYSEETLLPMEMFFGRTTQKQRIKAAPTSVVVYGGKRLGKSSLLNSIQLEEHIPTHDRYAVKVDITSIVQPKEFWHKIARELNAHGVPIGANITKGETVCDAVYKWVTGSGRSLLLMIDESDKFLAAEELRGTSHNLQLLRDLAEKCRGSVKIVIAGLHNVQRLGQGANRTMSHFNAVRVGPFIEEERRAGLSLVLEPFAALGFQFESPDLVHRLLSYCNAYPAVIQLFCKQLLESLYTRPAGNLPPYTITADDIQRAATNQTLRKEISDRFFWTLQLDSRYHLLALTVAKYGYDNRRIGEETPAISAGDARHLALSYNSALFSTGSLAEIEALLEELCGLGILSKASNRYKLRTPNVGALLPESDIEDRLLTAMDAKPEDVTTAAYLVHPRFGENLELVSPLSAGQIYELVGDDENSVYLIPASSAQGANDLLKLLSTQNLQPDEVDKRIATERQTRNVESFVRALGALAKEKTPVRVIVPPTVELDAKALSVISARNRAFAKDNIKVIIIAGARMMWNVGASLTGMTSIRIMGLAPWEPPAVKDYLEHLHKPALEGDGALHEKMVEITGGLTPALIDLSKRLSDPKDIDALDPNSLSGLSQEDLAGEIDRSARPVCETLEYLGKASASMIDLCLSEMTGKAPDGRTASTLDTLAYLGFAQVILGEHEPEYCLHPLLRQMFKTDSSFDKKAAAGE